RDEEQCRVGYGRMQVGEGVDGVGGAAAVDVDAADGEARIGRGGDHRHEVAVFGQADLALDLLPRLPGGHEQNLVEGEPVGDLAGRHQVSVVDRVERPAHDADLALHCRRLDVAEPDGETSGGAPAPGPDVHAGEEGPFEVVHARHDD